MRLIIDTDAGVDDAEALMMALRFPGVTVEAITTVTGNVHVNKVNRNVATVLQMVGASVPVYAGAALPLIEAWDESDPWHLNDGLGDWDERPPVEVTVHREHAANAIVRLVNEHPGQLSIIAIGPHTNIALALRLDPTLPEKVKQFVFMGGAYHAVGNTPIPTAEYNIYCDPEAAYMTLKAFPLATMATWEATLDHPFTWAQYDELAALDTPLGRFFRGITGKLVARERQKPGSVGYLLPDPLTMAVLLRPELALERETRYVTVELSGRHTRGQTVVNYTDHNHGAPNVDIVRRIDRDGVFEMYRAMLS